MVRPLDILFGKIPLAAEIDKIWGGARQKQAAVKEKLTGSVC